MSIGALQVNAEPHMGSAYTTIAADVIARFQRLRGRRVTLVTGTDEHGEKIAAAAAAKGQAPKQHCDGVVAAFQDLWRLVRACDRPVSTYLQRQSSVRRGEASALRRLVRGAPPECLTVGRTPERCALRGEPGTPRCGAWSGGACRRVLGSSSAACSRAHQFHATCHSRSAAQTWRHVHACRHVTRARGWPQTLRGPYAARQLDISYDAFIRTTDAKHEARAALPRLRPMHGSRRSGLAGLGGATSGSFGPGLLVGACLPAERPRRLDPLRAPAQQRERYPNLARRAGRLWCARCWSRSGSAATSTKPTTRARPVPAAAPCCCSLSGVARRCQLGASHRAPVQRGTDPAALPCGARLPPDRDIPSCGSPPAAFMRIMQPAAGAARAGSMHARAACAPPGSQQSGRPGEQPPRPRARRGVLPSNTYPTPGAGWYCVGCEQYKDDGEMAPGHVCPLHRAPCEERREENYFFALSRYQRQIEVLHTRHRARVRVG